MCFSNLPIEFDDEGNPSLAEEADDVDYPSGTEAESRPGSDCGCRDATDGVALDEADPEAVYEEILETMPRDVREQLADSSGDPAASPSPNRRNPAKRTEKP